MSDPVESSSGRSGCALVLGILLIATGVLFLAQNLFDYSLFRFFRIAVIVFADYWPVLLVIWGLLKIYQRFSEPSRARASAFEMVLLILIIVSGLTLRAARGVMDDVSNEMSFDQIAEIAGIPMLGAPVHRFSEERRFELGSSDGILVVNPGGNVKITGNESTAVEVVATKRIHHHSESEASRIAGSVELEFEGSGARPRLSVVLPEERVSVQIDLDIRLPKSAGVSIENRRGRVEVFDIAGPVEIETSHEGIEARNLTGGLRAETRHGDIRIDGVSGSVELLTRNGSITAERVDGDLRAEASHGGIRVEDVSGRALLDNRHADVRVARVQGPIEVNAQNSDVSVVSAGASVSIKTSHAPVFVRDVFGSLTIEASNAAIQARDVRGDVMVDDQDEAVTLVAIGGSVRLRAPRSEVAVEDIEGPVDIESSHDDVRVAGLGSS
ncbi:MAG: LiaF transmembrane domain-containing protein, partial [Vicinamibacteria bacterium]